MNVESGESSRVTRPRDADRRVDHFAEMFPTVERQVISMVFEKCEYDHDRTCNALLEMAEGDPPPPSAAPSQPSGGGADGLEEDALLDDTSTTFGKEHTVDFLIQAVFAPFDGASSSDGADVSADQDEAWGGVLHAVVESVLEENSFDVERTAADLLRMSQDSTSSLHSSASREHFLDDPSCVADDGDGEDDDGDGEEDHQRPSDANAIWCPICGERGDWTPNEAAVHVDACLLQAEAAERQMTHRNDETPPSPPVMEADGVKRTHAGRGGDVSPSTGNYDGSNGLADDGRDLSSGPHDQRVDCPVCGECYPLERIQEHVWECLREGNEQCSPHHQPSQSPPGGRTDSVRQHKQVGDAAKETPSEAPKAKGKRRRKRKPKGRGAAKLIQLFPSMDPEYVRKVLSQCEGNLDGAANRLMAEGQPHASPYDAGDAPHRSSSTLPSPRAGAFGVRAEKKGFAPPPAAVRETPSIRSKKPPRGRGGRIRPAASGGWGDSRQRGGRDVGAGRTMRHDDVTSSVLDGSRRSHNSSITFASSSAWSGSRSVDGGRTLAEKKKLQLLLEQCVPAVDAVMIEHVFDSCNGNYKNTVQRLVEMYPNLMDQFFHGPKRIPTSIKPTTITASGADAGMTEKATLIALAMAWGDGTTRCDVSSATRDRDALHGKGVSTKLLDKFIFYCQSDKPLRYYQSKLAACNKKRQAVVKSSVKAFGAGRRREAYGQAERNRALMSQVESARACVCDMLFASTNMKYAQESRMERVDLHGLHVKEALDVLKAFLQMHAFAGFHGRLSVITGIGKHSIGNQARIKPRVKDFLRAQGHGVSDRGGLLLVRPKRR